MDDNYPPYVFKDDHGQLKGITIDQWRLWEKKTGISVDISGMDWNEAQRRMQAGEFDVIDTIFRNENREKIYSFTKPYANIPVPLFFHTDISGISGPADAVGFMVAAKAGGNVLDVLRKLGISNIVEYPSYEKIIEAARDGKVKVFTVDRPPALYFLNKMGIQGQFHETKPLYHGEFHRAVLKGRSGVLEVVEKGFTTISPSEFEAIDKHWMGSSLLASPYVHYALYGGGVVVFLVIFLMVWLWVLKRAVYLKTLELTESEERFRSYIAYSPHGIFIADENGNYIDVNQAASTITGFSSDELLSMKISDLLPTESLEWGKNSFRQLLGTGQYNGEAAFKKKNGEIGFWSLAAAKISPTSFIGFVTDITGRVSAEAELREREAILTESQRVGHIGHYMLDVVKDTWACSAELDRILGLEGEVVKNIRLWVDLLHPDQRDEMMEYFTSHVIGQGLPFNKEYKIRRLNDNSERWVHGLGRLELDSNGHPLRMFGTIQDITDRKLAELDHVNLEKQLLHAQKMESLGVLAGGIAHDFNNILVAIMGNADLALMRINKESPATENLHRIEQAAARAADLAKQMLAYSGRGKFIIENIDLNHLLEDMLHMLEVSISKKAVLRLNLHQPLPPVEADATQMRQIIMNLVINASEAIGDKSGVIAITTGCMDCDRSYLKDVWLDENITEGLYVYLETADTGCGMDRETLMKLFDPFFTTKFTGRGLGMAAVLGIVRGHKGAIKVYSEPNKGTTFKILLPVSGKPLEIFNNDSLENHWQGNGTVLLVDDEETVRGVGAEMLKELGFNTITQTMEKKPWKHSNSILTSA
jgi:PAS domain S-box-containing protein